MVVDDDLRRVLRAYGGRLSNNEGEARAATVLKKLRPLRSKPSPARLTVAELRQTLVLIAEAAARQQDFESAAECVDWFESLSEQHDQFFCRMLLVQARSVAYAGRKENGVAKLSALIDAIEPILKVLSIAQEGEKQPRYNFLIYNASVEYWWIVRPLMKSSTFQYLLPSLLTITKAYTLSEESDLLWASRLQLSIVLAWLDKRNAFAAADALAELVEMTLLPALSKEDLSSRPETESIGEEALRLVVHVSTLDGGASQKLDPALNALKEKLQGRSSHIVAVQRAQNQLPPAPESYEDVFRPATGMAEYSIADSTDNDVSSFLRSLTEVAAKNIDYESVGEIGMVATMNEELQFAQHCNIVLQLQGNSMPPKSRALHSVLQAALLFSKPQLPKKPMQVLTRKDKAKLVFSKKIEAIKLLEGAVRSARRQCNAHLIERVCLCAWNLTHGLLRGKTRKVIARLFQVAADALEDYDSPLLELRVRLHLELSKFQVSTGLTEDAASNIRKATHLDYGTLQTPASLSDDGDALKEALKPEQLAKWAYIRCIDRELVPYSKRLDISQVRNNESDSTDPLISKMAWLLDRLRKESIKEQCKGLLDKGMEWFDTMDLQSSEGTEEAVRLLDFWYELASISSDNALDSAFAMDIINKVLKVYFETQNDSNSSNQVPSPLYTLTQAQDLQARHASFRLLLVSTLEISLQRKEEAHREADALYAKRGFNGIGSKVVKYPEETEAACMALLHPDSFVCGLHRSSDDLSEFLQGVDDNEVEKQGIALLQKRVEELEQQLLSWKRDILTQLDSAFRIALEIHSSSAIEIVCCHFWRNHSTIIEVLGYNSQLELHSQEKIDVAWLLPEFVTFMDSISASIKKLLGLKVDSLLVGEIAVGAAKVYEKLQKYDQALQLTGMYTTGDDENPPFTELQQKSLAEIQTRIQLLQNAGKCTIEEGIRVRIRSAMYLEAAEWLLLQQSNNKEKPTEFLTLATDSWKAAAKELMREICDTDTGGSFETRQEQLQIYVELWTRLGFVCYQFQQLDDAQSCAKEVLEITLASSPSILPKLINKDTYKWIALAHLLDGQSILASADSEYPPMKVVSTSIDRFVQVCECSILAKTPKTAYRAAQIAWNVLLLLQNDGYEDHAETSMPEEAVKSPETTIIENFNSFLNQFGKVAATVEYGMQLYGNLALLSLKMAEDLGLWEVLQKVAEAAISLNNRSKRSMQQVIPTDTLRNIKSYKTIASANMGNSEIGMDGVSANERSGDPVEQANTLEQIAAASWKNPAIELKFLTEAYAKLDDKKQEQAILLIHLAHWYHTYRFPSQVVQDHLLKAAEILRRCRLEESKILSQISTEELVRPKLPKRRSTSGLMSSESSAALSTADIAYSALWYDEKLVNIAIMKALASSNCQDRWSHALAALAVVQRLWTEIVAVTNQVELQEKFEQEKSTGMDFDEWCQSQAVRHVAPSSLEEWPAFFLNYSKEQSFHAVWCKALTACQSESHRHISQPTQTSWLLSSLVAILKDEGCLEMALSVSAFHLVVYHQYFSQKSIVVETEMNLTLASVMEAAQLISEKDKIETTVCSQIIAETHAFSKDIQAYSRMHLDQKALVVGCSRMIMDTSQPNVLFSALRVCRFLLQVNRLEQAQSLHHIMEEAISAQTKATNDEQLELETEVVSAILSASKGDYEAAVTTICNALQRPSIETSVFVESAITAVKLFTDKDLSIRILRLVIKQASSKLFQMDCALLASNLLQKSHEFQKLLKGASDGTDVIDLSAMLSLAEAQGELFVLLLKKSVKEYQEVRPEDALKMFRSSEAAFDGVVELLSVIASKAQLSRWLSRFAHLLLEYQDILSQIDANVKPMERAQSLLEQSLGCRLDLPIWKNTKGEASKSGGFFQLDLAYARTQLDIAKLEIKYDELLQRAEASKNAHSGTFNVVDTWLHETQVQLSRAHGTGLRKSDFSYAVSLATCAAETMKAFDVETERQAALSLVDQIRPKVAEYNIEDNG